jgi:hypothetical protein
MTINGQKGNIPTESQKIRSIIEKHLVRVSADIKAAFPPVLRQSRVLSAVVSQPEYLIVAFLTAEEEKRLSQCLSRETDPFAGLITTGPEKAAFRVEKATYATVRSCTVVNSFSLSLGPDSTILLEDHHQIIETIDIDTVSYTVPLAYVISYGDNINGTTVYRYLEGLVVYSTNMWKENNWLTAWPGSMESSAALLSFQGTRN